MFSSTRIADARELTARLSRLLGSERTAMADFIAALANFDEARHWEALGHSGLFRFLQRELGMSAGAAHYRKVAVDLSRRCPAVLDALRSGKLCITVVPDLARVLTAENSADVLPRFFETSRKQARHIAAELDPDPHPPMRDIVTTVRVPAAMRVAAAANTPVAATNREPATPTILDLRPTRTTPREEEVQGGAAPANSVTSGLLGIGAEDRMGDAGAVLGGAARMSNPRGEVTSAPGKMPTADRSREGTAVGPNMDAAALALAGAGVQRNEQEPLTAELTRLHTTVSNRCLRLLDAARAALSHSHPRANAGEILEVALGLLLEDAAKKKHMAPRARPRKSTRPATNHGPAGASAVESTSAGVPVSTDGCSTAGASNTHREGADASDDDGARRRDSVPAEVEREVRLRDQGRCQWLLHSGEICGETYQLEVDHVVPAGKGGKPVVSNLRLLCRPPEGSPRFTLVPTARIR